MLPDSADETKVANDTLAYIKITSVKPVSRVQHNSITVSDYCILRHRLVCVLGGVG